MFGSPTPRTQTRLVLSWQSNQRLHNMLTAMNGVAEAAEEPEAFGGLHFIRFFLSDVLQFSNLLNTFVSDSSLSEGRREFFDGLSGNGHYSRLHAFTTSAALGTWKHGLRRNMHARCR